MSEKVEKVQVVAPEILERKIFSFGEVVRERIILEGKQILLSTVYASDNTRFSLKHDPFFVLKGIVTEPTGLLIDQAGTQKLWGKPAGFTPEEFLSQVSGEALGVCPSNAGWQYGAFWVKDGKIVSPDKGLSGRYDVIALGSGGKWETVEVVMENGGVVNGDIKDKKIGFSFPLIVRDGKVVPVNKIVGDPRLVADLRNVVDFAAGIKPLNDFWLLLRKLLPASRVAGERLIAGQPVVVRKEGAMTNSELEKFQQVVKEYGLGNVLLVDERRDMPRLAIVGKLPLQKIPVVGVGFDAERKLLITAVDGRQPDSAGVTIEQLSQIMKDRWAVCAGLGCAGGDVAVILKKIDDSFEILNSPSNIDTAGKRITRRVPSLLILQ